MSESKMAKGKSPLFSEIRKGFKNVDIRTRRNKGIEIGLKRIPFNPETGPQQAHRARYGSCVQSWHALSEAEKKTYNENARPLRLSGYNLYMKECIPIVIEELSLSPTDDSFIMENASGNNYGSYALISVRSLLDSDVRSLLKFDLSEIPATAVVLEAKLYLYYYEWFTGDPVGRQYDLHRALEDWNEGTVTWANQPSHHGDIEGYAIVPSAYDWMIWDIKTLVQKWVEGTYPNYGVKLKDHTEDSATAYASRLYSKETEEPEKPYLYVKYQA